MSFGGVPQTIAAPTGSLESLARLTTLLDRAEPAVRLRFIQMVGAAQQIGTLEEIANLLEQGRINEALLVTDGIAGAISTQLEAAYLAAGLSSAAALRTTTDTLFEFNTLNARAVSTLQRERLRLVVEFNTQQAAASRILLEDAFMRGLAPIEQARVLRGSIGLSSSQGQAVVNYRRLLTEGTPGSLGQVLERKLRDRRFDPSIRAAARGDRVLTSAQIDRMVERYEERFVAFRANTIARTETVAAVGAGDLEMFEQAIEQGVITPEAVTSTWHTARDERVRSSHRAMNNQERPFGEPFRSGAGNALRFPGDPLGPPSDTINCRCVVGRKINQATQTRFEDISRLAAG